jgi:hypothetical protein
MARSLAIKFYFHRLNCNLVALRVRSRAAVIGKVIGVDR